MDRVRLVIDRTAAGLQDKVNRAYDEGYRPDGSFTVSYTHLTLPTLHAV